MSSLSPLPVCFVCFVFMVEVSFLLLLPYLLVLYVCLMMMMSIYTFIHLEFSEKREPQLRKCFDKLAIRQACRTFS